MQHRAKYIEIRLGRLWFAKNLLTLCISRGIVLGIFWGSPYLIFVTNISVENKSVMWRNFRFLNMTDVEKSEVSPHVEHFQIYLHDRGVEISNLSTYGPNSI